MDNINLQVVAMMENLRQAMHDTGAIATGQMADFHYEVHSDLYSVSIDVDLPSYYKFVNQGVNGYGSASRVHGSEFSFRHPNPSYAMQKEIDRWVRVKNIAPRDKRGRYVPRKQTVFVISRAIVQHGIEPRNFMGRAKQMNEGAVKAIKGMIVKGMCEDIIAEIKTN